MSKLMDLKSKLKGILDQIEAIASVAEKETGGQLTAEQSEQATKLLAEADTVKGEIKKAEDAEELARRMKAAADELGLLGGGDPTKDDGRKIVKGSIGKQFVESVEWQGYLKAISPSGAISRGAAIHSPTVPVAGLAIGGRKELIDSDTDSAGALLAPDFRGLVDRGALFRPFLLSDVVTMLTTDTDTVDYATEDTTESANAAAPVAGAQAGDNPYPAKPESRYKLTRTSVPVEEIAHFIPATERALADAGQLRGLIDQFLRDGLTEEWEDQVVNGSGVSPNLKGILNSGIQTQAFVTDILTTTRKAITKVQTPGRTRPSAWLMHPADVETVDLVQSSVGNYFFGGPVGIGVRVLWGVPVVTTEAVPSGTAIVGDFSKAVWWDRQQASIQATNSHDDWFIRNLVAIRATIRGAFAVLRPNAFVEVDMTA